MLGKFELAWCSMTRSTTRSASRELEAALSGMRANMALSGLLMFDVNTLAVYLARPV